MKKYVILLAAVAMFAWRAQADDNSGGNYFATLTVKGQTYTNAEIVDVTPAYVTVFYDGGGRRFALADLPADLRKRYHYNASKAREFDEQERAKHQEAVTAATQAQQEVAAAENAVGPVETIKVLKVLGGTPTRVLAATSFGQQEIFVEGFPQATADAFAQYDAAKAQADAAAAQAQNLQASADQMEVAANNNQQGQGTAIFDNAQQSELNAKQAQQGAAAQKGALPGLQKKRDESAKLNAQPTGKVFAGTRIWVFVSMASDKLTAQQ